MKLIVGLGNPGKEYQSTRHNIGFKVVDAFIHKHNIKLKKKKYTGRFYKCKEYIIAKPETFMNASGEFVYPIAKYYKIPLENILIIFDDMNIPIGKAKIKLSGSFGGQNGMKDILHKFNTNNIPRLKVGIGRAKNNPTNYVLGNFTPFQIYKLNNIKENLINAIEDFIDKGAIKAANNFNLL
jgi:PTH1 family peptidyl-tRNA hydrolase